jgi:hypothetical protein
VFVTVSFIKKFSPGSTGLGVTDVESVKLAKAGEEISTILRSNPAVQDLTPLKIRENIFLITKASK